jgi:hypothetical protein
MLLVRFYVRLLSLLLLAGLVLLGCAQAPPEVSQPTAPQLRITNTTDVTLDQVVVIFPNERIRFGPVPAGATTDYQPVRHGVYSYAAYAVTFNGRTVNQPVLDWMGAQPLAGTAFTYELSVDPQQPDWGVIQSEVRQE